MTATADSITVRALDAGSITGVSVGVIVALVVIGLLIGLIITKLLIRLVLALVVVVLAIAVWQQRGHIEDEINARACNLDATYFGVHLDAPDSVREACSR